MAWGAFEKEMLSGKHTEGLVSHSRSDHFEVTRQEVQARQLQEVIQKKKMKKRQAKKGVAQWSSNTTVCFALRFVLSPIQFAGFAEVLTESRLINEWISGGRKC